MTRLTSILLTSLLTGLIFSIALADPPTGRDHNERTEPPETRHETTTPPDGSVPAQLTAEQEDELLGAIEHRFPHRHRQLVELKESNPERYHEVIAQWWHRYQDWQEMGEELGELAAAKQELAIRSLRLARLWRQAADADEKEEIAERLRSVLAEKFDVEQLYHEKRLQEMQEQIENLRTQLASRAQRRDEIIQQELDRKLDGDDSADNDDLGERVVEADDSPDVSDAHAVAARRTEPDDAAESADPGDAVE